MRRSSWFVGVCLVMAGCGDLSNVSAQNPATTSTTAMTTIETSAPGLELERPPLVDPVHCQDGWGSAIEAARLDSIATWDEAPASITDELSEYTGRPISELGTWRVWSDGSYDQPLYALETPVSIEPLVYAVTSYGGDLAACVVAAGDPYAGLADAADAPAVVASAASLANASCVATDALHGPSVQLAGVTEGEVPVRINVDGVLAQDATTYPAEAPIDPTYYLRPAFEAAGWEWPFGDDLNPEVPAENFVQQPLVRHLAGSGENGPVAVSMEILSDDGWHEIQCGSAQMLFVGELPITCSVELVDGVPMVTAAVEGLPVYLERNGVPLVLPPSAAPFADLAAVAGERADYWAWAGFGPEGAGVDCGGVDVPADRSLRALLVAADSLAAMPAGPHVYWKYRLVCDGCDPAWTVAYFVTLDGPPDVALPAGHPGLLHPSEAHEFLLAQLDAGNEVTATFSDSGHVRNWTVNGVGVETECLVYDTRPPDMADGLCDFEG